ncbi:uncharacterized protein LOC135175039 [Pogoniulus pusillus]|uniref:uncharacterized protein LOC135175039 n=1 Tax=Pogoniulus pusillus TaxID=488313 RepID=UPI0030B99F3B
MRCAAARCYEAQLAAGSAHAVCSCALLRSPAGCGLRACAVQLRVATKPSWLRAPRMRCAAARCYEAQLAAGSAHAVCSCALLRSPAGCGLRACGVQLRVAVEAAHAGGSALQERKRREAQGGVAHVLCSLSRAPRRRSEGIRGGRSRVEQNRTEQVVRLCSAPWSGTAGLEKSYSSQFSLHFKQDKARATQLEKEHLSWTYYRGLLRCSEHPAQMPRGDRQSRAELRKLWPGEPETQHLAGF